MEYSPNENTGGLLSAAEAYIKELCAADASGHDHFHALRVSRTAAALAAAEGADVQICALAAMLHDADDKKLFPETHGAQAHTVAFLRGQGMEDPEIERITHIIEQVSFKGTDSVTPDSLEGKCVQDADRLDAIGAIGIARTFAYGGSRGRKLHDPAEAPLMDMDEQTFHTHVSTTVNHFYEKLFRLSALLNTDAARRLAAHRDAFMREFLAEFYAEWNGEK